MLLRAASFCAYLASWLVVALAAVAGALPRLRRQSASPASITPPVILGTLLQAAGLFAVTMSLGDGPLRPASLELLAALPLAPLGAALFAWALRSAPPGSGPEILVTHGPYRRLRHPIYLAFLLLLAATGLLASAGLRLLPALALYLAGTELRIADEEADLSRRFPEAYPLYQKETPWRYLPGIR